jgi:glycosyltransferase involved in cell wall biosynthesis
MDQPAEEPQPTGLIRIRIEFFLDGFSVIICAYSEERWEALAGAFLVVLLSEGESHPVAVIEALALGRPVLVADTSGLCELAEAGWARAIPLHSTSCQVAAAILEQLRQPLTMPITASAPAAVQQPA